MSWIAECRLPFMDKVDPLATSSGMQSTKLEATETAQVLFALTGLSSSSKDRASRNKAFFSGKGSLPASE
jgi:hypothetical protein